ncbi:MAG: hypothetical protein UDB11_03840 [Peptococcaceae bacterium]|nr:hypothetical protein [Peptococcaceae bacterium]
MSESVRKNIIHYIITVIICFGFGALPPFGDLTPYGMGILGAFLGAIYGWSTIDMIWPSIVAMVAVGLETGMTKMLGAGIANPVVAGLLILFPMFSVLSDLHVTEWLANKFITNRFALGRPWVGISIIFLGAFLTSFINTILVVIIFCTFAVSLCNNLGIAPYSKFATSLVIGIVYAIMLGQVTVPFIGTGLTFSAAYQGMFQTPISYGKYLAFIYPAGIVLVLLYVLVMKYIIRVDVSPLKNLTEDMLGAATAKLSKDQKKAIIFFLIFVVLVVLSSVLPKDIVIGGVLSNLGFFGICAVLGAIMMLAKRSNGEPMLNFSKMAEHLPWEAFFMTAFIMVISAFLTTPETGLNETIADLIMPMTKLNPWIFIVLVLCFAAIVTNFANNVVLTIVIMPILFNFGTMVGMNPTGLILILLIVTQLALATPGASPVTAIAMTYKKIVKVTDMMKMSLLIIPIMLILSILVCFGWSLVIF